MTDHDAFPIESPLTQSVTREGKTVRVEIYQGDQGGWLLEVVDEHGNSTVWDASFASDEDALAEAFRTIDEEGIDALIGKPSSPSPAMDLDHSLSDDERDELDDFLADEAIQERSMDVATLEGFLTALAIGPRFVVPSEWLPWVWDMNDGEAEVDFDDETQAKRILSLILRQANAINNTFNTDPAAFEPIFWRDKHRGVMEWCEGFILGLQFSDEAWTLLAVAQPTWFAPFLRLGTDDGIDLTASQGDTETWMSEIEPCLVRIHRYWKERRDDQMPASVDEALNLGRRSEFIQVVRGAPKIGRNDPCPCGSGKKFKKCCGANGVPASLH